MWVGLRSAEYRVGVVRDEPRRHQRVHRDGVRFTPREWKNDDLGRRALAIPDHRDWCDNRACVAVIPVECERRQALPYLFSVLRVDVLALHMLRREASHNAATRTGPCRTNAAGTVVHNATGVSHRSRCERMKQ